MPATSQEVPVSEHDIHQSTTSPSNGAPRASFLGLPKEIRLEIYDWVFCSTTLFADDLDSFLVTPCWKDLDGEGAAAEDGVGGRVGAGAELEPGEGERGNEGVEKTVEIYRSPAMTEQLNLVCRLVNEEIGQSWHSKVTYDFPCTVAFVDIFSQWPQSKIESVRNVRVDAYPLPLNGINKNYYCTHCFLDVLPTFPGLRLDLLTVENIWLLPDGEELDGWCLGAVYHELCGLLQSQGWRRFEYVSGTLGFLEQQKREVEEAIDKMTTSRGEGGYQYWLADMRPRLTRITSVHADGTQMDQDSDEAKAEVTAWKKRHPDADGESTSPTELEVQAWAVRGSADYTQTGEGRTEWIQELLEHDNWIALRKSGKYLVCDGMDDPSAHL